MFKASSKFLRLFLPVLACLTVGSVQAQNSVLENYQVALPAVPVMKKEELAAQTDIFTTIPFNDKALEYEMNLPKDWENTTLAPSDDANLDSKVIGELARFYGPARLTSRSYATVQAINIEYKMSAEHWVLRYLLSQGFTSRGMKNLNENRTEFAYYLVTKDATYFVHAVAQINGKRVLLLEYFLPTEAWKEEQKLQKAVVESFKIKNPVQEEIEKTEEYRFLDVAKIRYPETWKLKALPIRSIDAMEVQILNYNTQQIGYEKAQTVLDGKMEIYLTYYYSIESLEKEIQRIKDKFERSGLKIKERVDSSRNDIGSIIKQNKAITLYDLKVFRAENETNRVMDYEFWMTVLQAGDYYYFFTLLTPARTDDFFVWSRNAETYNLVVKSFNPIMDSLIYEE